MSPSRFSVLVYTGSRQGIRRRDARKNIFVQIRKGCGALGTAGGILLFTSSHKILEAIILCVLGLSSWALLHALHTIQLIKAQCGTELIVYPARPRAKLWNCLYLLFCNVIFSFTIVVSPLLLFISSFLIKLLLVRLAIIFDNLEDKYFQRGDDRSYKRGDKKFDPSQSMPCSEGYLLVVEVGPLRGKNPLNH